MVVDITNPLDFSRGMPPRLAVCNDDSVGEQLQRAFPRARVVKALNTVAAPLMVDPRQVANGDHHLPICGNDADARAEVTRLLQEWFSWRHIVDLGDITNARGNEMYVALWLRLWQSQQNPLFNVKIVA